MSATCTAQPISFLRLERYLLDELVASERGEITQHLEQCVVCRACAQELRDEVVELAHLPTAIAPARMPALARPHVLWTGAAALALTAAVLLMLRPRSLDGHVPGPRLQVKGGEVALELVREHGASIALDTRVFAAGDRFKLRVTCPPQLAPRWDVVVFQGREAFFPLQPTAALTCGNSIALPGAFALDGLQAATVCAVLDATSAIDRARVRERGASALPELSVCNVLTPVH